MHIVIMSVGGLDTFFSGQGSESVGFYPYPLLEGDRILMLRLNPDPDSAGGTQIPGSETLVLTEAALCRSAFYCSIEPFECVIFCGHYLYLKNNKLVSTCTS